MRRLGHHFSFSSIVKISLAYMVLLTGLSALLGPNSTASADSPIPEDAIRIRIIAHSDSAFDQQVKRDVRDRVASLIQSWGAMPSTHDQARDLIASHLPEIQETASAILTERGVSYGAEVELAKVSFPDKMFDGRSYAAGDYEALRISLGGGEGANWWCVLFPPLCLTAATAPDEEPAASPSAKTASAKAPVKTSVKTEPAGDSSDAEAGKPEARFFLWELLEKLGEFLKALFS